MTAVDDRKTTTPEDRIAERFARETADHEMTVLRDDGLYRHIAFRNREHGWNMWFELISSPGALIFRGAGDSFVFERDTDMFAFFRTSAWKGQPNYHYWAEKLTSTGNVKRYNQKLMAARVTELVEEFISDHLPAEPEPSAPVAAGGIADRAPGEKLRDFVPVLEKPLREPDAAKRLRAEVKDEILDALTGDHSLDLDAVNHFRFHIKPNPSYLDTPDFEFHDAWELDVTEFDWWYQWACQAIVWGIRQYDASLPVDHVTSWWQRPLGLLGIKTGALCNEKILARKVSGPSRKCRDCHREVIGTNSDKRAA